MFAAAALVAVAGNGSAQVLKAEIPFAFRAGSTLMQPGAYQVKTDRSGATVRFYVTNLDTNATSVLGTYALNDPKKAWVKNGLPMLAFDCVEARCALREVWTGDASSCRFFGPALGPGAVQIAEIRMAGSKGE